MFSYYLANVSIWFLIGFFLQYVGKANFYYARDKTKFSFMALLSFAIIFAIPTTIINIVYFK